MTTVANFITNDPTNGKFRLRAGEAITKDDLLLLNYKGLAYKATNIVNARVSTCTYGTAQTTEGTGRIISQSIFGNENTFAYNRNAIVVDSEGSIFTLASASSHGLRLSKYLSNGSLAAYIDIEQTNSVQFFSHHIFILSNRNIACIAQSGSDGFIKYAIYTPDLTVIRAYTSLNVGGANNFFSACPLSGGGFAVVYHYSAGVAANLATISNTGNVVLSPTTVWTQTGSTQNSPRHRIEQLTSGNLVIAWGHNNTTGQGVYHGVVTTSGVVVSAFTSIYDQFAITCSPELSVIDGYYCVASATGSAQIAAVFNNAGVMQGSVFSSPTTDGESSLQTKLVNDGTMFMLLWKSSVTGALVLTKLTYQGSASNSFLPATSAPNFKLLYIDAFCENGLIVVVGSLNGTGYGPAILVIDQESGLILGPHMVLGASGESGIYPRLLPIGDFSFVLMDNIGLNASTIIIAGKYANASIIGTAYESAAEGELVRVNGSAGAYVCNPMIGAISKSFDHSASDIVGNKGTIMPNSVVLKGI